MCYLSFSLIPPGVKEMPLASLIGNKPCLLRRSSQGVSRIPLVSAFCQILTPLEPSLKGLNLQSSAWRVARKPSVAADRNREGILFFLINKTTLYFWSMLTDTTFYHLTFNCCEKLSQGFVTSHFHIFSQKARFV